MISVQQSKELKPLWEHQIEGIDKVLAYKTWGLLFDMGVGKSCIAVNVINQIQKISGKCKALIVCPKSVIPVWPVEFAKHSELSFKVLELKKGSVKDKSKELDSVNKFNKSYICVINYESSWRDPIGKIIKSIPWDIIILDESHRISAPGSKVSWFFKDTRAEYKVIMTGTPMSTPLSIYGQFRFLNKSIFGSSFNAFKHRYAVEINCGSFQKVVGYQNQEEMNEKIYSIANRVMLKDVISLPEESHIERYCELEGKTMKLYKQLEKDLVAEYKSGVITASNGLVKILRLAQICGGYVQTAEAGSFIDTPKTEVLMDICEDLPMDEPIVIFFRFTKELQNAKQLIEKSGRTVGMMSENTNDLADWQAGKYNTLCINISKGGVGIDLTRSHYCIYYSKGYNMLEYQQSLARTLRPGQTDHVIYYHIIVKDTIDEIIERALKSKEKDVFYVLNQLSV